MRALVTGASGFTGRHLVKYLHSQGCSVHTLGRKSVSGAQHHPLTLDYPSIQKVISNLQPDYLFHLAGCMYSKSTSEFLNINVLFASYLLEALESVGLSEKTRVLMVGSAAEYGEILEEVLPLSETVVPMPYSLYGISKLSQTQVGLNWAKENRKLVVVRPFTIVGPGMPQQMAVGHFVKQIGAIKKQGGSGTLFTGNTDVQRDHIFVKDAVDIYWKLLHTHNAYGKVVNVCSGQSVHLQTILAYLIEKSQVKVQVKQKSDLRRSIDMKVHYGDNRLLNSLLGPMDFTPWQEVLNLMLEGI